VLKGVKETSDGGFVDVDDKQQAAMGQGFMERPVNSHADGLYLAATLSTEFLQSQIGRHLLRDMDVASAAFRRAAEEKHAEDDAGGVTEYAWAKMRTLHPNNPGALMHWGKPKHQPPAHAPGQLSV